MMNSIHFACYGSVAWEIIFQDNWIDAGGHSSRQFFNTGIHQLDTREFNKIRPIIKKGSFLIWSKVESSYESSPSQPIIEEMTQKNNKIIELKISIPTTDANGNIITGLSNLIVFYAAGDENIFINKTVDEILQLPNVFAKEVSLTEQDAGEIKTVEMPIIEIGKNHFFAAACKD